MAKNNFPVIISAFLLNEGSCVFYVKGSIWTNDINQAKVIEDADALETFMATASLSADENYVNEIYTMHVSIDESGNIQPVDIREKIRVNGPSFDLSQFYPATAKK